MRTYNTHNSRPFAVGFVVFIVAAISAAALIWNSENIRMQAERTKVVLIASSYANTLQQTVDRSLSSTYALAALVRKGNGSLTDFDEIAREMLPFYPGVALGLAPGGIVKSIIPLVGNEGAIGHDMLSDPARSKESVLAKETGKLTLAGPFELKQGGIGAVARLPVYLDNVRGQRSFWGFTTVLLRFPDTLEPARLSQLVSRGFHYELWRIHPDTGKKQVIAASSSSPLVKPVDQTLALPNGSWTLSVEPIKGWGDPLGLSIKVVLGLVFSLMLGYIALLMVKLKVHEMELNEQILMRTSDLEREIAERRQAEKTLILTRFSIEHLSDGIFWMTPDARILDVNDAACRSLGYSRDELLQLTIPDIDLFYNVNIWREHYEDLRQHGTLTFETEHSTKDGKRFPVEIVANLIQFGSEEFNCSIVRNITERKQIERSLQLSEERYRLLAESISVIPWEFNIHQNRWTYVGPQVTRILGYAPDEWTTLEWWLERIHPEDKLWVPEYCSDLTARGETHSMEYRIVAKDGSAVWVNDLVTVEMQDGKPYIMRGVIVDITEQKLVDNALRERELLLSSIYNSVGDAIFDLAIEAEGKYRFVSINQSFESLTGLTEDLVVGKMVHEVIPEQSLPMVLEKYKEAIEKKQIITWEEVTYYPAGRLVGEVTITPIIGDNGTCKHLVGTVHDITKRKQDEEEKGKLEIRLQQAQKLESVGRLAGGVAHDFNNLLTIIYAHVELALNKTELTNPLHTHLTAIFKAAERSAALTRQLLAFARKQNIEPTIIDLNVAVADILKMLQPLIGENVDLALQSDANLWPVYMDPAQIDQILTNLCVNARDAITDVGKISIEMGNCSIEEAYCGNHIAIAPGEYVHLVVSDNGCGIDPEVLTHIFEPFFTTKGVGEGTGLGLATVYGIVKQNNGFIDASSEQGLGTTFTIYLPRYTKEDTEPRPTGELVELSRGGHETILLVEDNSAILAVSKIMLEMQGYTVLSTNSPGEAFRMARAHSGKINLILTDVVMPEMNGRDLAKNVLSLHPNIKCLFMSGYTADIVLDRGVQSEGLNFIEKPFSIQDLTAKVREVLDS